MVVDVGPLTGPPTMNSWPIRCACVIWLKTFTAAVAAVELLVVAATAVTEPAGLATIPTPVRAAQAAAARMDFCNGDKDGLCELKKLSPVTKRRLS